jgi:hypothetical protein
MKIGTAIRDHFSRKSAEGKSWPSIVMLLRHPQYWSEENLLKLADAAWGMSEENGRVSPKIIHVSKDGSVLFQLATSISVNIHQVGQRYSFPKSGEDAPDDPRTRMWTEHNAWCAIDIPNRYDLAPKERRDSYMLLMHFINKVWSKDVCGLYLPGEEMQSPAVMPSQIPNLGDLIASVKWSGTNPASIRIAEM